MSPLEASLVAFTLAAALLLLAVIHSALRLVWFAALILGGLLLLFGARLALSRA
jgi:hypothetical protein